MDGPDDIALVFAALERIPERGFFTKERAQRDVAEEIAYQLMAHRDWIRPHVERLVRVYNDLHLTFDWLCLLMENAPGSLIAHLVDRHLDDLDDYPTRTLLMASRTPSAMATVATTARSHPPTERDLRDLGFHLPSEGPAEPRFVVERRALLLLSDSDPATAAHSVGLPLAEVAAPSETAITFHYWSVTPSAFPSLPQWQGRAHLVSVRDFTGWVMWASAGHDGRLTLIRHEHDDDHSLDDLNERLDDEAKAPQPAGAAELVPFDDRLIYANMHIEMTPGFVGVIGGPPMGLAPSPLCVRCGRLMFHIGWTGHTPRAYGDGFRSLFICEDCRISATLATLWN